MALLHLNDYGTSAVLRQFGLTPQRRIGRGLTCAVYDDGAESVYKLTVDPIQRESVCHYLDGKHFPAVVQDIGHVGEQGKLDLNLYLFKAERLRPTKDADSATRKLASQVLKAVNDCWDGADTQRVLHSRGSVAQSRSAAASVILDHMVENRELPLSIREAFEDLRRLVWDYRDLVLDFHCANFMVRGTDELVFNDVVASGELLFPN